MQSELELRAPSLPRRAEPLSAEAVRWLLANLAAVAIGAAFLAGALVRGYYVLREDFPVNDGGLFYTMARDLQAAGYLLPQVTTYNGGDIPYVYSPLALYAAALGDALSPASLMDMFWLLPLLGSLLALWAVYRLADAIFRDRWIVAGATLAFALAPRSFLWLVMGGGLPRSFGLAFALLAVREAWLLTNGDYSRRRVLALALLAALTALTHLETACFLAVTVGLVALTRPSAGIPRLALAGLLGAAIVAPWFAAMVALHGLGPFAAALGEGGRLLNDGQISPNWALSFFRTPVHTSEPYFPLIGALGIVGAVYAMARGLWFVPIWWIVTGLMGMRAFPTYVTVATCLCAGVAVGGLLVPAVKRHLQPRATPYQLAGTALAAGFCLWFAVTGAVTIDRGEVSAVMKSLPVQDRAAMDWARRNTPEEASFAVIPVNIWPSDYPSEWFPALAQRRTLTTPQGYEWVPEEFERREDIHEALWQCHYATEECVEDALSGLRVDYVYLPSTCCDVLKESFRSSEEFRVVFQREGALIVGSSRLDQPGPAPVTNQR